MQSSASSATSIDLFSSTKTKEPLAARMRPRTIEEYIGQDHIIGPGRLLRRAIMLDRLSSVIFYGPPGTGKTTLARVIANHTKSNFVTLNAVLTGVQDIRVAIKEAEMQKSLYQKRTILFVDEVHRWNKSQQDALLPWVENGTIILIGATTENPFFEVNKALVSRSRVFELKTLTQDDLKKVAGMALDDKERGYGQKKVEFEGGALEHLIQTASGDARSLLNALELAVETTPTNEKGVIYISKEAAEESIQQKVVLYDKDGDYHYDVISAFIKSIRGRDPDATMYWLARMVAAGESPNFIFRRMLISACEDTGLADPNAICVVEACQRAFDTVGLPEGRYHLAHAALYLSTAKKSNSSMAFFDALKSVEKEDAQVPNHLKDANRDADAMGHGKGYLYPHSYQDHWVAQQYLPDALKGRVFYSPSSQGYEAKIKDEVLQRRETQIAVLFQQEQQEQNIWQQRLETKDANLLQQIKEQMLLALDLQKNSIAFVFNADSNFLVWQINRLCPLGLVCGTYKDQKGKELLLQYGTNLDELSMPHFFLQLPTTSQTLESICGKTTLDAQTQGVLFDSLVFLEPFLSTQHANDFIKDLAQTKKYLGPKAKIVIATRMQNKAQRLSCFLSDNDFVQAEKDFYETSQHPFFDFSIDKIAKDLKAQGFSVAVSQTVIEQKRKLSTKSLNTWFQDTSLYGSFIKGKLGAQKVQDIQEKLAQLSQRGEFLWKSPVGLIVASV